MTLNICQIVLLTFFSTLGAQDLSDDAEQASLLHADALAHYSQGQFEVALAEGVKSREFSIKSQTQILANEIIAKCYVELGQYPQARAEFRKLFDWRPVRHQTEKGSFTSEQLMPRNGNSSDLLFAYARCLFQLGETELAKVTYYAGLYQMTVSSWEVVEFNYVFDDGNYGVRRNFVAQDFLATCMMGQILATVGNHNLILLESGALKNGNWFYPVLFKNYYLVSPLLSIDRSTLDMMISQTNSEAEKRKLVGFRAEPTKLELQQLFYKRRYESEFLQSNMRYIKNNLSRLIERN